MIQNELIPKPFTMKYMSITELYLSHTFSKKLWLALFVQVIHLTFGVSLRYRKRGGDVTLRHNAIHMHVRDVLFNTFRRARLSSHF